MWKKDIDENKCMFVGAVGKTDTVEEGRFCGPSKRKRKGKEQTTCFKATFIFFLLIDLFLPCNFYLHGDILPKSKEGARNMGEKMVWRKIRVY